MLVKAHCIRTNPIANDLIWCSTSLVHLPRILGIQLALSNLQPPSTHAWMEHIESSSRRRPEQHSTDVPVACAQMIRQGGRARLVDQARRFAEELLHVGARASRATEAPDGMDDWDGKAY